MDDKKSAVTGKRATKNSLIFLMLSIEMALYCTCKPTSSKKDKNMAANK